jgi:hypothetical protein
MWCAQKDYALYLFGNMIPGFVRGSLNISLNNQLYDQQDSF